MSGERKLSVYVLTGTCSTGKTTLLEHYKQRKVPSLSIVEEAAREFYEQNVVPTKERGSLNTQQSIQDFYIRKFEDAKSKGGKIMLCDSSALSSVAYAARKDINAGEILLNRINKTWLKDVTLFLFLDMKDVNYIFDPSDRIRRETPEEREQIQDALLNLLIITGVPYQVITGTLDERIAQIDNILSL